MRSALLLAALVVGGVAQAKVLWVGDFETGNLSQYSKTQIVSSDRMQVVSDDPREGNYAVMATVEQGDDPIGASGNRNELVYMSNEREGDEFFYKWSTKFDESYPSHSAWQLFAQWHHSGCCGSPPVQFTVNNETMSLAVGPNGEAVWQAPLVRGVWRDFVFHVKWSADASVGFVELWVDGEKVLEKTGAQTLFPGEGNYMKVGLYRSDKIGPTGIVYHDGWMMADALEDVMPRVAEPTTGEPTTDPSAPPAAGGPTTSGDGSKGTSIPIGTSVGGRLPGDTPLDAQVGCAGSTTGLAGLFPLVAVAGLSVLRRRKRR